MLKRLRIKFVCINMLIVTVMLGGIFGMVLHFTDNSMRMEGRRMMQMVDDGPGPGPEPRGIYVTVQLDEKGKPIHTDGGRLDLSEEELEDVLEQVRKSMDPEGELPQYDLRYLRKPMPKGEEVVLGDTSAEHGVMVNLVQDCLLISGISLIAFFFISVALAHWAVKPVAQAWDEQRRFVADASHELKTPLTVIMTNAELLQSQEYSQEQKERFQSSIFAMSQQMRGLVEQLLNQARVDGGRVQAMKSPMNLSEAVSEAVLSFEAVFFEKGLELESEIEDGLRVIGSDCHLRQVTEILLDNAVKYSDPGTARVVLRRHGGAAVLSVSNPGPAISKQDLCNIFKRFYRIDEARSMNRSYGLGLSIAEKIVREHRGKIKAESENGTNTFTVSVPLIK